MIVAAHIARKLVQGRATQIRVPANARHCPFVVGRDYAVQPHHVDLLVTEETGRETELRQITRSIGRVQVIEIRRTTLDDLTLEDARREGFTTRDEHAETWRQHRRTAFGHLPVWVLTVRPHVDRVRLLAPSGSQSRPVVGEHHADMFSGQEHDYTTNRFQALPDEPEVIDPATLDPAWRDQAAARLADAEQGEGTPGERLDRALAEARASGVNTSYLEKALEQRLQAIQRAARKVA